MPTATHHSAGGALPRPVIAIGVPCAGVLLVAFFLLRGFPYDELGKRIANRIETNHGIRLVMGDVGPVMQLAGPALEGTQLRVTLPDESPQQIDRALVRPAWSLSWFAGEPAFHIELDSPSGSANGTISWNGAVSWVGTIRDVRPELPPIADWIPIGGFEGDLEAELDASMGEEGFEGVVEFEIRDGSISIPGFSAPLPFENLTGAAILGGDAYAKLTSLDFEGPIASGSGSGKIARVKIMNRAAIGFQFQVKIASGHEDALGGGDVKINPGGNTLVKLSGTVAKPKIR